MQGPAARRFSWGGRRERLLAAGTDDATDRLGRAEREQPRPDEHAERLEGVTAAARAFAALKPSERLP